MKTFKEHLVESTITPDEFVQGILALSKKRDSVRSFEDKIKQIEKTEGFVGAVRYVRSVKRCNLPTAKGIVEKVLGRGPTGTDKIR